MKIYIDGKAGNFSIVDAVKLVNGELATEELEGKNGSAVIVDGEDITLEFCPEAEYVLDETVIIKKPVKICGNGATIRSKVPKCFSIETSNVEVKDLKLSGGIILVNIDSKGRTIQNISFEGCTFEEYVMSGVCVGSTESMGVCKNLKFLACSFYAKHNKNEKGEELVSALDIIFTAACGNGGKIEECILDDVVVDHCTIHGPSICNFMIVPGLSLEPENTPIFENCSISNVKIINNKLYGSNDTAVAAQANYINNFQCHFENLDVSNNICEFGLTGISASAGTPMIGDCDGIYMKNVYINNNILNGKPDVGETRTAIGAGGGGINYYSCSCHNSYVQNLEIKKNKISCCERGITLTGGSSMVDGDASSELCGNYVIDVRIEENTLTDVENCFLFYGAWIEGRRFDWNWGKNHTTQTWLPHVQNHALHTMTASDNYIKKLYCKNNHCKGFSYLLRAAGAIGRGHGLMKNNRMDEEVIFQGNSYEDGENHIYVADTILEDWVKDCGGNKVDINIKNI